jgi:hypothetical protein
VHDGCYKNLPVQLLNWVNPVAFLLWTFSPEKKGNRQDQYCKRHPYCAACCPRQLRKNFHSNFLFFTNLYPRRHAWDKCGQGVYYNIIGLNSPICLIQGGKSTWSIVGRTHEKLAGLSPPGEHRLRIRHIPDKLNCFDLDQLLLCLHQMIPAVPLYLHRRKDQ